MSADPLVLPAVLGARSSVQHLEAIGADRALANVLPLIIWTCDAQGRLEWVNDRWFEVTGLSEEQTLNNKGALIAVHPDDRDELARCWSVALETSRPTELEYRIRTVSGEYRWHFARAAPVRGTDGEVTRWVAAVFDIHDRRMAEDAVRASERQFDSFFHLSPIPMAITRQSDGAFLFINAAFTALTGFTRDEAIGRTSTELGMVSGEARAAVAAHFSAAHGRSFEVSVRMKDGQPWTILLFNSHIDIGGVPCFLNTGIDVTERRAMEDALRRANQEKDEFLAMLSHELRNPLTPILTSARLLERSADANARDDLNIIVHQVKHMSRLIDDLLDIARVTRGAMTLSKSRIEAATAVARAVAATAPLFQERGHRLVIDIPEKGLQVDADGVRLTQIFDNLLSNAARYTAPAGVVRVSGRREANMVELCVRDTGRGIERSLLPRVFDTFIQAPRGADRADGGLGVGLSLVRALVELHGGTVTANSEGLGLGSEFTVRLPLAATDSNAPTALSSKSPAPTDDRRRRVLLVEDHPAVSEGLTRLLRALGYEVRAERNPVDAIATAEVFQPEVALLDIGLPVMDGYELAAELRARFGRAAPVLIALSGYNQPLDLRHSESAGFATHLVKPIDAEDLVNAIDRFAPIHRFTEPINPTSP